MRKSPWSPWLCWASSGAWRALGSLGLGLGLPWRSQLLVEPAGSLLQPLVASAQWLLGDPHPGHSSALF